MAFIKPATAAPGGGTMIQDVTFATTPCAVTKLEVKVSGTNLLNIEGVEAVATGSPVTVDRTVDPLLCPGSPGGQGRLNRWFCKHLGWFCE